MFNSIISAHKCATDMNYVSLLRSEMASLQDTAVAFHFSADYIDTPFHVTMWAPHLDDAGIGWYAICRERHHFVALKAAGVRAVLAPSIHLLPMAMAPHVRAVLYANNAHRNLDMLRCFPDKVHVQMLHGDSDKPPSYSPVTANFDKIFVAGQLGRDRYSMNGVIVPEDAFVHVGRPQVKIRPIGMRPSWQESPVIAYMPTWFGGQSESQFSSLDRAPTIIREIRKAAPHAEIIFKPHPLSYKDPSWGLIEAPLNAAISETGATSIARTEDAGSVYDRSDMLITDISSTIGDFLYSNRPLAVVMPRRPLHDLKRSFPMLSGCYRIAGDIHNLSGQVSDALVQDSLHDKRTKVRAYAFGDDDGPADGRFIAAVRHLAGVQDD